MAAEKFKFVRNFNGENSVPPTHELPVAASQTLAVGDALVLSSGKIAKASTSFGRCLGICAEASTNAAEDTLVKFYVSQPGQVWKATASADATSHLRVARTYDLNSSQVVNVADTTGGCIYILELNNTSTTVVDVMFTAHELA